MLTRASILNLRCLKDVSLEMAPFMALVGPNASGKSTLLSALNPRRSFHSKHRWRRRDVRVQRVFDHPDGGWTSGEGTAANQLEVIELDLQLAALRPPVTVQPTPWLPRSGGGLPNVLATMGRRRLEALVEQFCAWLPEYQDIDVRPHGSGKHEVVLQDRWDRDVWFTTDEVSDGTMLMLAYLTLAFQEKTPDLVTIEEPGRGLHPYLLSRVVALLRELSRGLAGNPPVQIVVATHSPDLLDLLRPEEVYFVERDRETGATTVSRPPTDEAGWSSAYDAYRGKLGAMWLSGGLGAVPGRP